MEENRVVITGMGCVTPIGIGTTDYKNALRAGISGSGPLTRVEDQEGLDVNIACEVKDFNPMNYMGQKLAKGTDICTQFSLVAAKEAIYNSDLLRTKDNKLNLVKDNSRLSVIIGTGIGGFRTIQEQTKRLYEKGPGKVSVFTVPRLMPNAVSAAISLEWLIRGDSYTTNSACSSANHAIADAYDKLILDRADVVISGGAEAAITKLTLSAFSNMKALTKEYNASPKIASRPFDADRSGFVMGEGAGIVVMERLEHARARDAHIYAEILGYGATSDAFHLTAPDEEGRGATRAMKDALKMAELKPEQVEYINAHGTSTPLNDAMETKAIRKVFGKHADNLLISSTKSMTGHSLGASGGMELIATVLGMNSGFVHPTINYETPDTKCDLNYVPNQALEKEHKVALLNSFGFGGHNVCLAIKKWGE